MSSQKLIGIILLVLGIILLYFGWQASQSPADQVTEAVTGEFTRETMLYLIGGAISVVVGAFLAFARR